LAAVSVFAAEDPISWTLAFDTKSAAPGGHLLGKLTATLTSGWHLYSATTPPGGPNPTTLKLADSPALASFKFYQPKPERKFDQSFQIDTETFLADTTFLVDIEIRKDAAKGPAEITALMRYQACTDLKCLPPKKKQAVATIDVDPSASASAVQVPANYTLIPVAGGPASAVSSAAPSPSAPAKAPTQENFGWFLLTAFGFGLAAIFTPCVFPMIPITVSYFINRQDGKRDGLSQAIVFCLGIVVLFTSLGLLAKAVAGPFGVVKLGSSPWVNGFITIVFIVFGFSLLGAFELTLPSGFLTRMDSASRRGGYLGTLIMGLTFSLTSFACVGPIVGPLFVASLQGEGFQPVLGMVCFASGLAAPFFLLALFPSYLQRLPKRGMWMARIKVVLGFVVLAAAVKYLSNVDSVLQLGFITRDRFLAAWVVMFAMAGLYLLGILKLEGVDEGDHLSVGRTIVAALFLIFAISLIPGMWCAPLGELEAYVPAAAAGSCGAGGGATSAEAGIPWMKNQYREALAKARQENKLVLINFSGYACTNCHWMKANMFTRPEIVAAVKNLVPVELYTDGSDAASELNQQVEEKKFGTIAIPYYAIVDADEKVVATFPSVTRDPKEFLGFLNSGGGNAVAAAAPGA